MNRLLIATLLATVAIAPAFAGDDNPGKHKGHDRDNQSLSNDNSGDQGARGGGLYSTPGQGVQDIPELRDDGRQPGFGTLSAPGQD
jgi:hypothetical protein